MHGGWNQYGGIPTVRSYHISCKNTTDIRYSIAVGIDPKAHRNRTRRTGGIARTCLRINLVSLDGLLTEKGEVGWLGMIADET
jgi:hypothetical protein